MDTRIRWKYTDLKRPIFTPTRLQEERDKDKYRILSVRLNEKELTHLEEDARILRQEKPATALKQLAEIGSIVIRDPQSRSVLEVIFENQRRNQRLGIQIAEPSFHANVVRK
jgi:hypothetical protein